MSSRLRIACLTLHSSPGLLSDRCRLGDLELEWDVIPVIPDLTVLAQRCQELQSRYDGVALDGLVASFQIGTQLYQVHQAWHRLGPLLQTGKVCDGSALRVILDRHLVRQAGDRLSGMLRSKRALVFCGISRFGAAEVLSKYCRTLTFGDLMYGYRIGVPMHGLKAFEQAAPQLARVVDQMPMHWFWPNFRHNYGIFPMYYQPLRHADVLVGGIPYFERYAPAKLTGKVVFSSLRCREDLERFVAAEASAVVSLTPLIDGSYVPESVLELALRLSAGATVLEGDFFLNQVHRLGLTPQITELAPVQEDIAASAPLDAQRLPAKMVAAPEQEVALSAGDAVGKFCFVIHPLKFEHVERIKIVKFAKQFFPRRVLEDMLAQAKPFPVGAVRGVVSKSGARAEGLIYAVPMTSHAIMRFPPEFLYRKLLQVAHDANKHGCKLMGLGAYTSVVGDAGITVSQLAPIGITTGNSYTVAATLQTLEEAAQRCGVKLEQATALVVGASGSIGSICARLLAGRVRELLLASPRPEKLLALSQQIEQETPGIGSVRLSRNPDDLLGQADVIITTTSAVDPVVDVAMLRPGCVVCDVARPPDIKPEAAAKRDDILVIESGEIQLPPGSVLTYDIGLPAGTIYACLAETLLLALAGRFGHFTLGREIEPGKVREMAALGAEHGFELADIRSFGAVVPVERYARLREINSRRFT